MSYVGNFKPNQNVPTLWKALKELSEEIPTFSKDLEIIFAGNVSDIILNDLKKLGLFNNLKQKGYISHSEATQLMTTSCLLIFVIPQTERNHLILTGKIFEYLASGSQMLSIGPPQGNASEIIKSSSRSPMLDYQNLNEIKSQVYQSYLSWKENSQKAEKLDSESIQNFTRKAQAEKLEKILLA
jgi:glycosyltransferase involved in cell wall biosynthesis